MKITHQIQHQIDNLKDQVVSVAQDTTKLAHDFSVLVYAGVTATIKDSVNGYRNSRNS